MARDQPRPSHALSRLILNPNLRRETATFSWVENAVAERTLWTQAEPGGSVAVVMDQGVIKLDVERKRAGSELARRGHELEGRNRCIMLGGGEPDFAREQFLLCVQDI